jgi:hypothetical protein
MRHRITKIRRRGDAIADWPQARAPVYAAAAMRFLPTSAFVCALAASLSLPAPSATAAPPGVIERENALPGTRSWLLEKTQVDPATKFRCPWIEGYCSRTSARAGDQISFFVSTNPAADFTIDLFRLGYYGGEGGRLIRQFGPLRGFPQPDPPVEEKRLRNCQWQPCVTLTIPPDWVSGVYVGKLTERAAGMQSYSIFIVRDDRPADLLFQCSDTTWQAYNRWPSQFALYDDGKEQWYWGGNVQVSFNRPYGRYCQIFDAPQSQGSGEFLLWEFPLAFWLEKDGWDVSYISNLDSHADAPTLLRAKGILSVGHDEYWTMEMYQNFRTAIRQGVSVAFLSGNTCCGRILYDPKVRGFERIDVFGPPDPDMNFVAMGLLPHRSPWANSLLGAHSTPPVTGGADWTCRTPGHWLFQGTGMQAGDGIPGLVGWEWHGDPDRSIPGLEILASGPTFSASEKPNGGHYTATLYPGPSGNVVFNASTIWWSLGLSSPPGHLLPKVYTEPKGPDPRVQTMTRNLLQRMIRKSPTGG